MLQSMGSQVDMTEPLNWKDTQYMFPRGKRRQEGRNGQSASCLSKMCLRTGRHCSMFSRSLQWFERQYNNLYQSLVTLILINIPKLFKCKCLSLKSEDESLNIIFSARWTM